MGFRHFLTHQVEYHVKNVFFVKVFAWYSAGCMYTFSSTLTPLHRIICIEKHSICELLRRVPSLCLALSIELAFAAHCMHTHALPPCRTRPSALFCLQSNLVCSCRQLGKFRASSPLRWMKHGLAVLEFLRNGTA